MMDVVGEKRCLEVFEKALVGVVVGRRVLIAWRDVGRVFAVWRRSSDVDVRRGVFVRK